MTAKSKATLKSKLRAGAISLETGVVLGVIALVAIGGLAQALGVAGDNQGTELDQHPAMIASKLSEHFNPFGIATGAIPEGVLPSSTVIDLATGDFQDPAGGDLDITLNDDRTFTLTYNELDDSKCVSMIRGLFKTIGDSKLITVDANATAITTASASDDVVGACNQGARANVVTLDWSI